MILTAFQGVAAVLNLLPVGRGHLPGGPQTRLGI